MKHQELCKVFDKVKEPSLATRRFKHSTVLDLINKSEFQKEIIGQSYEGRDIYKIKIGTGPKTILLWSQMHGNEATATMAIFDIFRFFEEEDSSFHKLLKDHLSIHFIPMLNPDGAERFTRRTAQQIDMNRDAIALACPESVLLKKMQINLKPEFSFNLHDQNVRYAAGNGPNQAAISFLATAYNQETEWNECRTKAMQVICGMNQILKEIIPHKIGRFTDEFEPRAFGDNIQKWGSSLILIESGGFADDIEKQFLRKLNFVIILKSLEAIALESYKSFGLKDYNSIPCNEKSLFDLLIHNVSLNGIKLDIGINLEELNNPDASDFEMLSTVEDLGDLSTYWGIKELDGTGLSCTPLSENLDLLTKYNLKKEDLGPIEFEKKANFALSKDGKPQYFVVNGMLYPST